MLLYIVQERTNLGSMIEEVRQVFIDNWYFLKKRYCVCIEKESLDVTLKKSESDVMKSCCEATESIRSNFEDLMNSWSEYDATLISKEFRDAVSNVCDKLYSFKISMLTWLDMLELHFVEEIAKSSTRFNHLLLKRSPRHQLREN